MAIKKPSNILLKHPDIQAISFVGFTPVAEYIQQQLQHTVNAFKRLVVAKNHGVVMPDVDLEQVADALVGAAYGSAGERCMALSVAVAVGDKLGDALVAKIKPKC